MTSDKKFTLMGTIIIILLLVIIGLNLSQKSFRHHASPFERHEKIFNTMLKKAEATSTQIEKLTKYKDTHAGEMKNLHDTVKKLKDDAQKELLKENPDMEKIKAIHEQIKQNMNKGADHMFNMMLHMRKTLSREQFEKIHHHMEKIFKKGKKPPHHPMHI